MVILFEVDVSLKSYKPVFNCMLKIPNKPLYTYKILLILHKQFLWILDICIGVNFLLSVSI